jgi:hypothetical protein
MTDEQTSTDGADDLAILFPERTATVAGVAVTMREYTFMEGMQLHALIAPLVEGMVGLLLADALPYDDAMRSIFGDNAEDVATLIATACDQPREWVVGLGDEEGNQLRLLWWAVNGHFFGRRVRESIVLHQLRDSAGQTSLSSSPAPDSTPIDLATKRVVN